MANGACEIIMITRNQNNNQNNNIKETEVVNRVVENKVKVNKESVFSGIL